MKLFNILLISIYSILITLLYSGTAEAASVTPVITDSKDGVITITVLLDTEGQSVNVVSGTLHYDPQILDVRSVRTTDSIVSLWIDRPSISSDGSISYSGAVPGGFDGVRSADNIQTAPGVLFTILVTPRSSGVSTISLEGLEVRANDGNATALPVDTAILRLSTDARYQNAVVVAENPVSPVDARLTASVFRDSTTENKWVVAFAADTNRVTVVKYEVAESLQSDPLAVSANAWNVAESPFVLNEQFRTRYVHVRAVAENGQVYMTTVPPKELSTTASSLTWSILVVVFLILVTVLSRLYKRRKQ